MIAANRTVKIVSTSAAKIVNTTLSVAGLMLRENRSSQSDADRAGRVEIRRERNKKCPKVLPTMNKQEIITAYAKKQSKQYQRKLQPFHHFLLSDFFDFLETVEYELPDKR